jgi:protein O-GlcNAc transferase
MDKNLKELFQLYKNKDYLNAEKKCCDLIDKIKPNFEIFNLYAVILYELKKFDEAIKNWKHAIELNKNYFFGYNNLGNVYLKINQIESAINNYSKAIKIKSDYFEAFHNRANAHLRTKNIKLALKDFDTALNIKYDYIPSLRCRASIFKSMNLFDKALSDLEKIIMFNPKDIKAYSDKADIFFELNELALALENYQKGFELEKEPSFIYGNFLHTKTKMCDWTNFDEDLSILELNIKNEKKISPPYPVTTLIDSPELQFKCSKIWTNEYKIEDELKFNFEIKRKSKIKLGFFSADLRTHPMGHLMIKMLERHNREKFELHAFYFGPDVLNKDPIYSRMLNCFKSFTNIKKLSNKEAAKLSRKLEIDIAVDCMGFTGSENKFGIFLNKAAPIQINYLGYPGTSGSKCMDYIVADKTLIPKEYQKYYSEKIIYLPDTYQPNEDNKQISQIKISKKDFNLPEDKFIFACFNSHQKINPKIFLSWIKILKYNQDSVLWLLKDNQFSEDNLKKFILNQGVDPSRLIFTDHLPLDKHLARLKFTDLLLDTFPYNAHTSCSDALRVGVPIITIKGKSFASRVASSLINTIDMNKLITSNFDEYEVLALKISKEKNFLNKIKNQIFLNKQKSNLFNSSVYTKNIERAYEIIYQKYTEGKKTENIFL